MQIWLKRKGGVICVILSQPKFFALQSDARQGNVQLVAGRRCSSSAVTESSGYTYGASLTLESLTCALL